MEVNTIVNLYLRSLKSAKKSQHTIDAYERNINEFIRKNNIQSIEEFKNHDLTFMFDYVDSLNEKFEANTVNQKIATIKTFYKFLLKQDIIEKNVTKAIEEVAVGEKIYPVLDSTEVNRLLEVSNRLYLEDKLLYIRNKLIIRIFLENGLRAFEMENLRLSNINYEKKRILIKGKWNIERYVFLNDSTYMLLLEYLEIREQYMVRGDDKDFIFITKKGTRLKKRALQDMTDKYIKAAEVTEVSTHGLRHTCATNLYDKGYSMKDIQTILGHKRISTTEKYIHALNLQRALA